MKRKEFLSIIGIGAAAVACTACLGGCKQEDSIIEAPTDIDFTLDLTDANTNNGLNSTGVITNGVIVVKTAGGIYRAVSSGCTHQGVTVFYRRSSNDFYCSSHGSRFNPEGGVITGPATRALTQYNTSLNANLLRVYS